MKKLFLIMAITLMATTAWAQSQLQSVKGKTKDGKSINVQYYKGTAQDYIESVKYQLVDELTADNKNKQNSINDLQYQLNKANKTIDNLKEQLKKSGGSDQNSELQEQLNQKQSEIDQLNEQVSDLNNQLNKVNAENEMLQRQLDSIKAVNLQLSQSKSRPAKSPIIGVEANMGSVFLTKNLNPWEKALSWNKQVDIYFGTGRLAQGFPVSIEAGVGFRSLPMLAKFNNYNENYTTLDCDGDAYRPIFEDCSERLTMNCLEVPVRFCLGQPNKNKVSVYTKLGVTPSFILSSNLKISAYSSKGYYPNWNVTFEDIGELGFTDEDESNEKLTPKEGKRFNLWANAALGAYVPLSSSILFNVGAKLDYPIMKTGTFNTTDDKHGFLHHDDLTQYDDRMLIPNLQLGLIYTLK